MEAGAREAVEAGAQEAVVEAEAVMMWVPRSAPAFWSASEALVYSWVAARACPSAAGAVSAPVPAAEAVAVWEFAWAVLAWGIQTTDPTECASAEHRNPRPISVPA